MLDSVSAALPSDSFPALSYSAGGGGGKQEEAGAVEGGCWGVGRGEEGVNIISCSSGATKPHPSVLSAAARRGPSTAFITHARRPCFAGHYRRVFCIRARITIILIFPARVFSLGYSWINFMVFSFRNILLSKDYYTYLEIRLLMFFFFLAQCSTEGLETCCCSSSSQLTSAGRSWHSVPPRHVGHTQAGRWDHCGGGKEA